MQVWISLSLQYIEFPYALYMTNNIDQLTSRMRKMYLITVVFFKIFEM